jgi:hypothetical protein
MKLKEIGVLGVSAAEARVLSPRAVGEIARQLKPLGCDVDPREIAWIADKKVLRGFRDMPAFIQHAIVHLGGRCWRWTRDIRKTRKLVGWLCSQGFRDVRRSADPVMKSLTGVLDAFLAEPAMIERLRGLFSTDHPLHDALHPLAADASVVDAMSLAEAIREAKGIEENAILAARAQAQREAEQRELERRRRALHRPFPRPDWAPEDQVLRGSKWRIVRLDTQAKLAAEGDRQRHCVATYGERVRAGSIAIYSVRRDATDADRQRGISSEIIGATVAFTCPNNHLTIVEARAYANGPLTASVFAALSRTWPAAIGPRIPVMPDFGELD